MLLNAIRRAFAAVTLRRDARKTAERRAAVLRDCVPSERLQRRKQRLAKLPRRKRPDGGGLRVVFGRIEVAATRQKFSGARGLRA